jgi:hypothetical protein
MSQSSDKRAVRGVSHEDPLSAFVKSEYHLASLLVTASFGKLLRESASALNDFTKSSFGFESGTPMATALASVTYDGTEVSDGKTTQIPFGLATRIAPEAFRTVLDAYLQRAITSFEDLRAGPGTKNEDDIVYPSNLNFPGAVRTEISIPEQGAHWTQEHVTSLLIQPQDTATAEATFKDVTEQTRAELLRIGQWHETSQINSSRSRHTFSRQGISVAVVKRSRKRGDTANQQFDVEIRIEGPRRHHLPNQTDFAKVSDSDFATALGKVVASASAGFRSIQGDRREFSIDDNDTDDTDDADDSYDCTVGLPGTQTGTIIRSFNGSASRVEFEVGTYTMEGIDTVFDILTKKLQSALPDWQPQASKKNNYESVIVKGDVEAVLRYSLESEDLKIVIREDANRSQ